jgi:flagellar hook-associated protein 3 FlgL
MGYDVGYNQVIDVNTLASDVFTTDVRRSMDDLTAALEKLQTLETTISQIKDHMEGRDETSVPPLSQFRAELAAAEKAQTFLREEQQEQLEHKITEMQRALDVANLAVTQNGTRSRRLELIQNRLMNQTTTFKTLQSDNEDIDMAETATNLSTSQTVYNAALMATGKISQTSLMDYI